MTRNLFPSSWKQIFTSTSLSMIFKTQHVNPVTWKLNVLPVRLITSVVIIWSAVVEVFDTFWCQIAYYRIVNSTPIDNRQWATRMKLDDNWSVERRRLFLLSRTRLLSLLSQCYFQSQIMKVKTCAISSFYSSCLCFAILLKVSAALANYAQIIGYLISNCYLITRHDYWWATQCHSEQKKTDFTC